MLHQAISKSQKAKGQHMYKKKEIQPPGFIEYEMAALERHFHFIDRKEDGRLDAEEVGYVFHHLGVKISKQKAQDAVWEVDDDGDGFVSWEEFVNMYIRGHMDKSGHEPRALFNVVEFMMHDSDHGGTISFDEAVVLLYKRHGRNLMDSVAADIVKVDASTEVHFRDFLDFLDERQLQRKIRERKQYGYPSSALHTPLPPGCPRVASPKKL